MADTDTDTDADADPDTGQVTDAAAEVYDSFFVPALFRQWTDVVLDLADVRPGDRVLDLGCGTGVLTLAARARAGEAGHVVGLDPNDGMLAVARRNEPRIEWMTGSAEALPFPADFFDRTVSQFALMYVADQATAFEEVARVTRQDGRVALAVWDDLGHNSGFDRLAAVVDDLFGMEVGDAIRAPFRLGDPDRLHTVAESAFVSPEVTRHDGLATFGSLREWVHTEIRGWTLDDSIDDEGLAALVSAVQRELSDLDSGGGVAFPMSALVVRGRPAPA